MHGLAMPSLTTRNVISGVLELFCTPCCVDIRLSTPAVAETVGGSAENPAEHAR